MKKVIHKINKERTLAFISAIIWFVLILVSYFRNYETIDNDTYSLVLKEARSNFNKEVLYKKWASIVGDVYIPTSICAFNDSCPKTLPKNVETKEGKKFTLINPAYIIRLIHELEFDKKGIKENLTSLNPIHPENKADGWEKNALLSFAKGKKENYSLLLENGNQKFKFMTPLVAEESCLKCHSVRGYKVGDIIGGISVTIPYSNYTALADSQKATNLIYHLIAVLIGWIGLYVSVSLLEKHKKKVIIEKNELLKNDESFRLLSDAAKEGLIIHENGIMSEVNTAFLKMTGYSREELIGKNMLNKHIHPDDLENVLEKVGAYYEKPYELRFVKKDGTILPVEFHGYNVKRGKKIFRAVSIRDLTLQKLLEDDLWASEEKWRSIVKTSPDGIALAALDGSLNQVSDKLYQMFGYEHNYDVIGKKVIEFIDPGYHQKVLVSINALKNGTYKGKNEYLAVRKDGSTFYLEINSEILRNKEGVPTNIFIVLHDISERKQNEECLKASEENFRNFFSTMDDMIFIARKSGQLVYTNYAVVKKLGYSNEELKNMQMLDIYNKKEREKVEQIFADMLSGKRNECSLHIERKDGSTIPVETRIWSGKWDRNECIFGIAKDLSREQELLMKFNKIFEYNPAALAISSITDRKFLEINIAFREKLGYTSEEIVGKTADEINLFVEKDKRKTITDELNRVGHYSNIEIGLRSKSGEIITGLLSSDIIETNGKKYFLTVMKDITRLIQTEKALDNERKRLERIIDGTQAGTWEWNVQTGETIFNERWAQMLGYSLNELAPTNIKTWEVLVYKDDLKRAEEALRVHFVGESKYYDCEYRLRHKKGKWIWIHDRGKVVTWTDKNKPLMMSGTHTDITERKLIEEKLRESEERHRLLADNATDIIWTMDLEGHFTYMSPSVERLVGFTVEEAMEKKPEQMLNPVSHEHINNGLSKIIENVKNGEHFSAFRGEVELNCKDGSTIWLETTVSGIFKADGGFIGLLGVARDITERKKIENQLKQSEEQIRLVIEKSPVGIFFYDTDTKIHVCNSAFSKIIGSSKEQLMGLELIKLPRTKLTEGVKKTLQGEPVYFEEMYTAVTSGKSLYLRAILTPVFDKDKNVIGGIAIVEDFSERKKMEEQIRNYAQKLENTNEDLNSSKILLEKSLFEKSRLVKELTTATQKLIKTNSEKDKFFSIIAHDLRNPFQIFLGLTDVMANNINDFTLEELSEFTREINTKANNLFGLLKNLLEWSQMQRGNYSFEQKEIYSHELILKTIESIKPTAEKKNISIKYILCANYLRNHSRII